MKIKENATYFVTGPYPKTDQKSPEFLALCRNSWCSRVDLLRAQRTSPLPPLAPPSLSGANGRSHSARRGRKSRTRSPEIMVLVGFQVADHGGLRWYSKTDR